MYETIHKMIELEAPRLNAEMVFTYIGNPEFEKATRTHDWRNHVPDSIKSVWLSLSEDAKACVFIMASGLAACEEWD